MQGRLAVIGGLKMPFATTVSPIVDTAGSGKQAEFMCSLTASLTESEKGQSPRYPEVRLQSGSGMISGRPLITFLAYVPRHRVKVCRTNRGRILQEALAC